MPATFSISFDPEDLPRYKQALREYVILSGSDPIERAGRIQLYEAATGLIYREAKGDGSGNKNK